MFFCLCSYSYHVHRKTKSKVTWCCTVRNKEATICFAMVNQESTSFTRMGQDHTHEAVTGKATRVKAVVAVKDQSKANSHKSAYTIAEKLLLGMFLSRNKMN